jgi:HlyD family secretion protein
MRRSFLLLITTLFLFSCEEKVERSDAYGNFEATTSTVSSEANGRLISFQVEEGQ